MAHFIYAHHIVVIACLLIGAVGCVDAGTEGAETGSLAIDLVLADGIEIDVVEWRLQGGGLDLAAPIDVSGPGSSASIEVVGLPVIEEPYLVELSAVSVNEEVTCYGSAEFFVEADEVTDVFVLVECTAL